MELEKYGDIIKDLNKKNRKINLLMGNGFSRAYNNEIFSYNALGNFIKEQPDELLKKLFEITNNNDFEYIMKELDDFKKLAITFSTDSELTSKLSTTQENLKKSLINAVKSLHPDYVYNIPEDECNSCAKFLSNFIDTEGKIFSTNYDLLLYWVLMRAELLNGKGIDGFGQEVENWDKSLPKEEQDWSEVHWGPNKDNQNVFYLHGALQLFDTGCCIEKEKYDGFNYLLENINKRMNKGHYPLFVTGGTSEDKLETIKHNPYLNFCYEKLEKTSGSLVIFGFKFGDNDKHIINAINKAANQKFENRLLSIYIGCFSDEDKKHIESIEHDFKCKVHIFDAKTAHIWR